MLKLAVGSALLVTVTQTLALTLGPTQGEVIIGRPFDILVQSRIDPNLAGTDLCLQAQLFYGEAAVGSVSTAVHAAAPDGTILLRVRSTEAVNEPIVTLVLQAGCQNAFRRSYALLADFPLAPQLPVAAPQAAVRAPLPAVAGLASAGLPPAPAAAPADAPAAQEVALGPETPVRLTAPLPRPAAVARVAGKRPPLAVAQAPAAPTAPGPDREVASAAAAAPAPATAAAGARLQLDPVDLPAVAGPVSPVGAQLPVPDPAATPDPAQAAAEPAVPAPTELQQELQALRAEQERMQLALQTLNAQLLQAQAQAQAQPPWPAYAGYGLGALALLLLGGLWFGLRSGRLVLAGKTKKAEMPWWESSRTAPTADPDSGLPARASAAPASASASASAGPGPEALEATRAADLPLAAQFPDLLTPYAPAPALETAPAPVLPTARPAPTAVPAPAPASAASAPAVYDFPVWLPGEAVEGLEVAEGRASMFTEVPVSALDVGQLSDAWQQIEFCESIGQQRQAMELLKAFVTEHPRASEAVYLRWLALAGQYGNDAERSEAIRFYENHFLRLAPGLEAILATHGLDEDSAMLQRLQREWPQPAAQQLLEQALGSQPGDPQSPLTVRTLAAFDDLIHLLGVLQGLASSTPPTLDAALSAPMPWHALDDLGLPPLQTPAAAAPTKLGSGSAAPAADPMSIDFDFSRFDWEGKTDAPKPSHDDESTPPSGKP